MTTLEKVLLICLALCVVAGTTLSVLLAVSRSHWQQQAERSQRDADDAATDVRDSKAKYDELAALKRRQLEEAAGRLEDAAGKLEDADTSRRTAEAKAQDFQVMSAAQASEIKNWHDRYNALKNEKDQLEVNLNAVKAMIEAQTRRNDRLTEETEQLLRIKEEAVVARKVAEDALAKAKDDILRLRGQLKSLKEGPQPGD